MEPVCTSRSVLKPDSKKFVDRMRLNGSRRSSPEARFSRPTLRSVPRARPSDLRTQPHTTRTTTTRARARDDVGEPMHAQQHPGARHRDRDRYRNTHQNRPGSRRTLETHDQRESRERRGGGRRMAAGERGTGEHAQAVDVRPRPVDRHLDQVHEQELAADDDREEKHDRRFVPAPRRRRLPAASASTTITGVDPSCVINVSSLNEMTGDVVRRPPGDVLVDRHHAGVAPDHVDEDADDRAGRPRAPTSGGRERVRWRQRGRASTAGLEPSRRRWLNSSATATVAAAAGSAWGQRRMAPPGDRASKSTDRAA